MMKVQYYRCWSGNSTDHGNWDVGVIEVPENTQFEDMDKAIRDAMKTKVFSRNDMPVVVGFFGFLS